MPERQEAGQKESGPLEPARAPTSGNASGEGLQAPRSSQACDECRNRKVRCNRQLPECSNCKKAKIRCGFSARSKRVNRKSLASDLATVTERLSNIDGTTSQLAKRLDELTALVSASADSTSTPTGTSTPKRMDFSFLQDNEFDDPTAALEEPLDAEAEAGHVVVVDDRGAERFYGPFSTYALFVSVQKAVENFLSRHASPKASPNSRRGSSTSYSCPSPTQVQSIIASIRRKYKRSAQPPHRLEEALEADGQPLQLPPRPLLEASLEYYFDPGYLKLHVFQRDTISKAIEEQYAQGDRNPDSAWVSCFNSLIVLSLNCKSKLVRNWRALTHHSNDDELLATLMVNSKRALSMIEHFAEPRLVNLQALLLLALVARSYLHYSVFERVFYRTCQLAKFMGLQEGSSSRNLTASQNAERRSLIWALLAVDKQRVFIKGSPPHIYLFECNISMPKTTLSLPAQPYMLAHLQMVCLMEKIYKNLYSPKARKQPPSRREDSIVALSRQMQCWLSRHQSILEDCQESHGALSILKLQLKYIFFTTRITIHRCSSRDGNNGQRLDDSRAALAVIQTLSTGGHLLDGGLVALDKLFLNYSPVAFCDLFEDIMARPELDRSVDTALLATVTNVLGLLVNPGFPESYCARMHRRFAWCSEIARALVPTAGSANGSPQSPAVFVESVEPKGELLSTSMEQSSFPTLDFSPYDDMVPEIGIGSRSGSSTGNPKPVASSGASYDPMLSTGSSIVDFGSDGVLDFGFSSGNSTSSIMKPEDGSSFTGSLGQSMGATPLLLQPDAIRFRKDVSQFTPIAFDSKSAFDFEMTDKTGDAIFDEAMLYES